MPVPGTIRVGTCSWTDRELIDSRAFYPDRVRSPEERLRFYAATFPVVEADSTYYRLPSARQTSAWSERTPDHFRFDVKVFRLETGHWTPPEAFPKDLRDSLPAKEHIYRRDLPREMTDEIHRRFYSALEPLRGKIGRILYQFPPWFTPGRTAWAELERVAAENPDWPVAVEFRHRGWLDRERDATIRKLRELGLSLVVVDEPQGFASSVPALFVVTAPGPVLVRFHGRNRETWERRTETSAERFDYLYRPEELAELLPEIRHLAAEAGEAHLLFNTNRADQGVRNARLLLRLLGEGN